MSSQNWLTSHSKYKNISAGIGDSASLQTSGRRPLNDGPDHTVPCLTGWAAQCYIITHTVVGQFKAYQLSVDDLMNLFTYFNDYMPITI